MTDPPIPASCARNIEASRRSPQGSGGGRSTRLGGGKSGGRTRHYQVTFAGCFCFCSTDSLSATWVQASTPSASPARCSSSILFLTTRGARLPYQARHARAYMAVASSRLACMKAHLGSVGGGNTISYNKYVALRQCVIICRYGTMNRVARARTSRDAGCTWGLVLLFGSRSLSAPP